MFIAVRLPVTDMRVGDFIATAYSRKSGVVTKKERVRHISLPDRTHGKDERHTCRGHLHVNDSQCWDLGGFFMAAIETSSDN